MSSATLSSSTAHDDATVLKAFEALRLREPLEIFADWLKDAHNAEKINPEAMTLATVGDNGMPQARSLLLKSFDHNGFVFYTNRNSRKGQALLARPMAALSFYWRTLGRQVQIEGNTQELTRTEVERYYNTRPLSSRISAWASEQSQPVADLQTLDAAFTKRQEEFSGREPPLPPSWSGFRLLPLCLEFWNEGGDRLHRRLLFSRASTKEPWVTTFLQP